MKIKASILLPILLLLHPATALTANPEADLKEAVTKNDWPGIVLLLAPLKGQNFEHDLLLSKALLQLERRAEALKVLNALSMNRRDEKVLKLLKVAGGIFFAQDTSNLYFEGVRLLSILKVQEAKDRFEQAAQKESGHPLILTRLIQCEILLSQFDQAASHLKEALALAPQSNELRFFALRLSLQPEPTLQGDSAVGSLKRLASEEEVPFLWVLEWMKRTGKTDELKLIARSFEKAHPDWTAARVWLYLNSQAPKGTRERLKMQIDRGLKSRDRFETELEKRMRQSQYLWAGFIRYDDLVKQMH
jgi:tetratricopeptide (TPR) repeat protein